MSTPSTEPIPVLNEFGGVIHQVSGVVAVGSDSEHVDPESVPESD